MTITLTKITAALTRPAVAASPSGNERRFEAADNFFGRPAHKRASRDTHKTRAGRVPRSCRRGKGTEGNGLNRLPFPIPPHAPTRKHNQEHIIVPTVRSRLIDERHPVARWLYRAFDLPINGAVVMTFATPAEALKASRALSHFRSRGRLGPPGTFPEGPRDPRGEGLGHFDRISISVYGSRVTLRHVPEGQSSTRTAMIAPIEVVEERPPEAGSHVNTGGFDVVG